MVTVSPGEGQEEAEEEEEEEVVVVVVSTIEVGVVVIINSPAVEDVVEDVEVVVVEAMVTTHPAMGLVTKAVADQSDRLGTVNK